MFPSIEYDIVDLPLVSTNAMYTIGRTRRRKPFIRKSDELNEFYVVMDDRLGSLVSDDQIAEFKKVLDSNSRLAIRLFIHIEMPERSFFSDDSSNFIKPLEDAIKNDLSIDDSRNVTVHVEKSINPDEQWVTHVKLEIYELPFDVPDKWQRFST